MTERPNSMVGGIKAIANAAALVLAFPCAVTAWLEKRVTGHGEAVFSFWTHVFAMLPGHPGLYVRRAFYRLTLNRCSLECFVGFGSLIFHRQTEIESGVYIGPYAMVGTATLRQGCLIGSRASLLSGGGQHERDADGRWSPSDVRMFKSIEIGEHVWIGEAATVMADVGAGSVVSAGAVVSAAVPAGVVVAGNPARFVRTVLPAPPERTLSHV